MLLYKIENFIKGYYITRIFRGTKLIGFQIEKGNIKSNK